MTCLVTWEDLYWKTVFGGHILCHTHSFLKASLAGWCSARLPNWLNFDTWNMGTNKYFWSINRPGMSVHLHSVCVSACACGCLPCLYIFVGTSLCLLCLWGPMGLLGTKSLYPWIWRHFWDSKCGFSDRITIGLWFGIRRLWLSYTCLKLRCMVQAADWTLILPSVSQCDLCTPLFASCV